jgi:hypothetical protein
MLHPVFMSNDSMRPDMTWAAAIPKAAPETADSLTPNPNGFMELNDLPLMLDVVSMLNVDDERQENLKNWLLYAPMLILFCFHCRVKACTVDVCLNPEH